MWVTPTDIYHARKIKETLKIFIKSLGKSFYILKVLFSKKNYFPKKKKKSMHCFIFLQIPLTSGLTEGRWILTTTSASNWF